MKIPTRILAITLLAMGLAACQNHAPAAQAISAQPMQLKLYNVPPQRSDALMMALRGTVMDGKHGRVTQPFPGKLLVAAPAYEQASIGAAIATLARTPVANTLPTRLNVRFWVIDMLPGQAPDAASLKPLSTTLDALRKRMGPSHYVLDDSAMAAVKTGTRNNMLHSANDHQFEFRITSADHGLAQVSFKYIDRSGKGFRELETTTSIPTGDYVVLAQAAAPAHMPSHDSPMSKGAMRLLVVRVDKLDNNAH